MELLSIKKRICRFYLGIGFIILGISLECSLYLYQSYDYNYHVKAIDSKVYINNSDYLGYIEIPDLNIKREIFYGINQEVINRNVVGMSKGSISLDDDTSKIILAGHSIYNIFGNLHKVKLGFNIKIVSRLMTHYYKVTDYKVVDVLDTKYLKEEYQGLILITCMNDNNKRLLVYAKKMT